MALNNLKRVDMQRNQTKPSLESRCTFLLCTLPCFVRFLYFSFFSFFAPQSFVVYIYIYIYIYILFYFSYIFCDCSASSVHSVKIIYCFVCESLLPTSTLTLFSWEFIVLIMSDKNLPTEFDSACRCSNRTTRHPRMVLIGTSNGPSQIGRSINCTGLC